LSPILLSLLATFATTKFTINVDALHVYIVNNYYTMILFYCVISYISLCYTLISYCIYINLKLKYLILLYIIILVFIYVDFNYFHVKYFAYANATTKFKFKKSLAYFRI